MRSTFTGRSIFALLTSVTLAALGAPAYAQQVASTPTAMVGVSGTVGIGGQFAGTLLITGFDALGTNNGLRALGTVDGVLNGRNVVSQVAIPLVVMPGMVLPPAAGATTGSSVCDAVHVGLAASAFRVLGTVVTLAPTSLDISAARAPTPALVTGTGAASPVTATPTSALPGVSTTTLPGVSGTVVPASQVGTAIPGEIAPAPQPATNATPPAPLGQVLCSLSTLAQSTSSPAQLVPLMNQMLSALGQ